MSIKDLEPDGFGPEMRAYASLAKRWDVYPQGMGLREVSIWLRIDGVQTMIGYGMPAAALAEAETALAQQLAEVRKALATLRPGEMQ